MNILLIGLCLLGLWYFFYQIARNITILNIRLHWLYTNDFRRNKYTYYSMWIPSKHNLYGIKFPNEKDFNVITDVRLSCQCRQWCTGQDTLQEGFKCMSKEKFGYEA